MTRHKYPAVGVTKFQLTGEMDQKFNLPVNCPELTVVAGSYSSRSGPTVNQGQFTKSAVLTNVGNALSVNYDFDFALVDDVEVVS